MVNLKTYHETERRESLKAQHLGSSHKQAIQSFSQISFRALFSNIWSQIVYRRHFIATYILISCVLRLKCVGAYSVTQFCFSYCGAFPAAWIQIISDQYLQMHPGDDNYYFTHWPLTPQMQPVNTPNFKDKMSTAYYQIYQFQMLQSLQHTPLIFVLSGSQLLTIILPFPDDMEPIFGRPRRLLLYSSIQHIVRGCPIYCFQLSLLCSICLFVTFIWASIY